MSDTRPDVKLPAKTPVDLYAATGIAVGTQIYVQNNSTSDIRLYSGATAPTMGEAGSVLLRPGVPASNFATDLGAWAWSSNATSIQVSDVVEEV